MKFTLIFVCISMAVILGSAYDGEKLDNRILESFQGNVGLNTGDVRTAGWWSKAKSLGSRAFSAAQKGCKYVNRIPVEELSYRVSLAFPELVSEEEYSEDGFISGIRAGCKMLA